MRASAVSNSRLLKLELGCEATGNLLANGLSYSESHSGVLFSEFSPHHELFNYELDIPVEIIFQHYIQLASLDSDYYARPNFARVVNEWLSSWFENHLSL